MTKIEDLKRRLSELDMVSDEIKDLNASFEIVSYDEIMLLIDRDREILEKEYQFLIRQK